VEMECRGLWGKVMSGEGSVIVDTVRIISKPATHSRMLQNLLCSSVCRTAVWKSYIWEVPRPTISTQGIESFWTSKHMLGRFPDRKLSRSLLTQPTL
jgi:hypothetical protein